MIPVFVALAIYYGESVRRGAPLEWQRFAAIIVFLLAAASDGLDGYVARHYNQRSRLGVILDPIADKGLLLSGIITLSISNWSEVDPDYGRFPAWFPVIVITRDAVIQIARDLELTVNVGPISLTDLLEADEAFFTGTAAEVTPIREVDGHLINGGARGPITETLQNTFFSATSGSHELYRPWLTFVAQTVGLVH